MRERYGSENLRGIAAYYDYWSKGGDVSKKDEESLL
jgi:hypothetical protein